MTGITDEKLQERRKLLLQDAEMVEKRIAALSQQLENVRQLRITIDGSLQECEYWIKALATPPAETGEQDASSQPRTPDAG